MRDPFARAVWDRRATARTQALSHRRITSDFLPKNENAAQALLPGGVSGSRWSNSTDGKVINLARLPEKFPDARDRWACVDGAQVSPVLKSTSQIRVVPPHFYE